jgi:hypothetical protein
VEGPALRLATDRRHLRRALELGFLEVSATKNDQPLACRDGGRIFVWMPVAEPPAEPPLPRRQPETSPEEQSPAMNEHTSHGRPGPEARPAPTPEDPLAEAEAVRALLAEAQSRLARLISALKQHRRQTRAVQAAVASLRQLPPLAT